MAIIAARQAQTRQRFFVGREREIAQFRAMLKPDELPRIFFTHGPGGIGKSTLLHAYARIARDADAGFSQLDARNLRPVPMLLARTVELMVSRWADRALCVLGIDHYERLAALSGLGALRSRKYGIARPGPALSFARPRRSLKRN